MYSTPIYRTNYEEYFFMDTSELKKKINVPDIQRVIKKERVDELYDNFLRIYDQEEEIITPGVIIIGQLEDTWYILDGQHRFNAYLLLYENTGRDQKLPINKIQVETKKELGQLFESINNTVPVADIPKGIERKDSNRVVKYFFERYGKIFSHSRSGRTKRPHIHVTIFEENVAELLQEMSPDELINKINTLNKRLSKCNIDFFCDKKSDKLKFERFINTIIKKGGFYLGIYDWMKELRGDKIIRYRKSLPAPLRTIIWKKYYGDENSGECLFCSSEITKKSCHMAHDIAHINGGEATVNNLYPCCKTCNLSMGTKTYEEFKKYLATFRI